MRKTSLRGHYAVTTRPVQRSSWDSLGCESAKDSVCFTLAQACASGAPKSNVHIHLHDPVRIHTELQNPLGLRVSSTRTWSCYTRRKSITFFLQICVKSIGCCTGWFDCHILGKFHQFQLLAKIVATLFNSNSNFTK